MKNIRRKSKPIFQHFINQILEMNQNKIFKVVKLKNLKVKKDIQVVEIENLR